MAVNELVKQGTLLDLMNQIGPDGNLLTVAEVMQKATPILKDAVWVEANDTVQHIYSRRTSLPKSELLKFNKGVNGNYGTKEQVTSGLSARGNRPWTDARLVDLAPNKQEYRNQESRAMVEGIAQEFDSDIIYGYKATDVQLFDGLASYTDNLANEMVIGGTATGGSNKVTSAYIVAWDTSNGAYMAYPRGSTGGIKYEDKGRRAKDMPDGSVLEVYEDYVEICGGLCVADLRAVARYANIDLDDMTKAFDENNLIILLNRMPASLRSKAVIYVSPELHSAIEIRANAKENAYYTRDNVFGESLFKIFGTPIRIDEMISEAEEVIK